MVKITEQKEKIFKSKYDLTVKEKEFAESLIKDKKKGLAFLKKHGFIDNNNELHPNYR